MFWKNSNCFRKLTKIFCENIANRKEPCSLNVALRLGYEKGLTANRRCTCPFEKEKMTSSPRKIRSTFAKSCWSLVQAECFTIN